MTALDRLLAECEPRLWSSKIPPKLARIVRVLYGTAAEVAGDHSLPVGVSAQQRMSAALAEAERIAGEDA